MPPARANTFGPTMHVPASFQQQQQGGHPMGAVGVGGGGGMHNQLMDGNRSVILSLSAGGTCGVCTCARKKKRRPE